MSDERMPAIAQKLLETTKNGEVAWAETADDDTFSVAFPTYSVSIRYRRGYGEYTLSAHNRHGTEVKTLTATPYPTAAGARMGDTGKLLEELFNMARQIGVKTDEVLDGLLERLTKGEPPIKI